MGKQEGQKLTKKAELRKEKRPKTKEKEPPQAPPKGGDVRGNGRRRRLTTALRKEGMCLAGYGMLCVRDIKGEGIKAKSSWVNSQRSKV